MISHEDKTNQKTAPSLDRRGFPATDGFLVGQRDETSHGEYDPLETNLGDRFFGEKQKTGRAVKTRQTEAERKAKAKTSAAARYATNPEKVGASAAAWQKANPEKALAANSAWQKANPEKVRAKSLKWYHANKEKARAANAAWYKANPISSRRLTHDKRARKKASGGKLSPGLTLRLLAFQKNRCALCRKSLKKTGYHMDHIVPLVRGGKNEDSNIQLTCPKCNQKKGTKDPVAFMQSRGLLL